MSKRLECVQYSVRFDNENIYYILYVRVYILCMAGVIIQYLNIFMYLYFTPPYLFIIIVDPSSTTIILIFMIYLCKHIHVMHTCNVWFPQNR